MVKVKGWRYILGMTTPEFSSCTQNIQFVFLHSYSSASENWKEVVFGSEGRSGRLTRAQSIVRDFDLPLLANGAEDEQNIALHRCEAIQNLGSARNTRDEVRSALAASDTGGALFVSSPDHLPRVVRDTMAEGGTHALFAASDIAFSATSAAAIEIREPPHRRLARHADDADRIKNRTSP